VGVRRVYRQIPQELLSVVISTKAEEPALSAVERAARRNLAANETRLPFAARCLDYAGAPRDMTNQASFPDYLSV